MDNDILVQNIITACIARNELPTNACIAAGVGKSFISDIKRGRTPSVGKVASLAAYLCVSTSDLVGDNVSNPDTSEASGASGASRELVVLFEQLNPEGREKLLDYADDLVLSGKYIKNHPHRVDKEA